MTTWLKQNATLSNILKVLIIVFVTGGGWVMYAVGDKINVVALFGQDTRTIVVSHIDDTKGDPLSEIQLQNKVENIENDVNDHSFKLSKHEEVIQQLVISKAVQQVQNISIMDKLEMIAKKLDIQ